VEFLHEKLNVDSNDGYSRYIIVNPTSGFQNMLNGATSLLQVGVPLTLTSHTINLNYLPPGNYFLILNLYGTSISNVAEAITISGGSAT
jgi:hypothetical protein